MEYSHFEAVVSPGRLRRYYAACFQDRNRSIDLYRANLRLSGKIFQVICMVEIALRNAIDQHNVRLHGNDWIVFQSNPGGYLAKPGCERSRITAQKAINELGLRYSHDKTVAELNFGFWRYAFALKEFAAAGSTLLQIFPNRPHGISQRHVFDRLGQINDIRNRIAHHEPICFDGGLISTQKVELAYQHSIDFLDWLGLNRAIILKDIDFVPMEIQYISTI